MSPQDTVVIITRDNDLNHGTVLNEMVYFMGTLRSQKFEVGRGSGDALAQPHCSGPCPTDLDYGWRLHSQARQHAPVFNPPHGRNDFMFEDCL